MGGRMTATSPDHRLKDPDRPDHRPAGPTRHPRENTDTNPVTTERADMPLTTANRPSSDPRSTPAT